MASLADAFKRHIEDELPIAFRMLDPHTKSVYSKAWRRGYAQARKDLIEEWSKPDAERDEVVRTDPNGSYRP